MKNVKARTAATTMVSANRFPADQSSKNASGIAGGVVTGVTGASVLSMGPPPVLGRRDDLDGLGADDVDDHHLRPRRQRVLERDGLVLGRAVLDVQRHLADAG